MDLRLVSILTAAVWLAGCATPGPLQPSGPDLGLVVASVRFGRISRPFPDHYAQSLYLAPVSSGGEIDIDRPIASRLARERQVYFFNVPPGRYVVIGGSYVAHGLRYRIRFKPEHALQTAVTVKPGGISFAGVVLVSRNWQDWLAFTLNILRSAAVVLPPWRPLSAEVEASFRSVDRTSYTEIEALTAARRHLAGSLWLPVLGSRLESLGGPSPEIVSEGFWRKRSKPAQRAERFSWVDTLEWGPPRPIRGGLEWRQPKDKARVAVLYFKEAEAGVKPREEYLRELKTLGSPEDTHSLVEVRLSTLTAQSIRYTKYVYPQPYLTGSVSEVFVTETMVAPDAEGYYVLLYRALRKNFEKFYPEYRRFREQLRLEIQPPPEEPKAAKK
ncbi:MAG TPA: hypothetical protein DEB40_11030 [Elusimicrobia bacterium]|nr:hypothetical protein [Elusimicrobiota bacterium]HBT62264.1 hypothetical protein [Elusimicrobiota bacterium]